MYLGFQSYNLSRNKLREIILNLNIYKEIPRRATTHQFGVQAYIKYWPRIKFSYKKPLKKRFIKERFRNIHTAKLKKNVLEKVGLPTEKVLKQINLIHKLQLLISMKKHNIISNLQRLFHSF